MDMNKILMTTYSGVRQEENAAVMALLGEGGLHTTDLSPANLRDFIVARKGDAVIGVVGLEMAEEDALLRSLTVASRFRGQGIAAGLVDAIERYARSMKVVTLYLLTVTAAGFFRKQGYETIQREEAPPALQTTAEFASLCPDTAVCMRKKLTPSPAG